MSGRTLIFDADACKEQKYAPWEVKSQSIQTAFIMSVVYMWDAIFNLGGGYTALQTLLAGKYAWTVYGLMNNAVTKVVLLEGGKKVEFTFGKTSGSAKIFDIKDIKKQAHEKTLVQTFEESTMFPLKIGKETYYIHG